MVYNFIERSLDVFVQFAGFPLVFLLLPWLLWATSIVVLKKMMERYIKFAGFFLSASIIIYIYALVFGWIMRDGLGAGAVASHGELMVKRLVYAAMDSMLLATPTSAMFLYFYIVGRRKPE